MMIAAMVPPDSASDWVWVWLNGDVGVDVGVGVGVESGTMTLWRSSVAIVARWGVLSLLTKSK